MPEMTIGEPINWCKLTLFERVFAGITLSLNVRTRPRARIRLFPALPKIFKLQRPLVSLEFQARHRKRKLNLPTHENN